MDVRAAAERHIEELLDYAAGAGYANFGREPVEMTPMAYCSGALHALHRIGVITEGELHDTMNRCNDAYGLKRPPEPEPGQWVAYKPEWGDVRPEWPRRHRSGTGD